MIYYTTTQIGTSASFLMGLWFIIGIFSTLLFFVEYLNIGFTRTAKIVTIVQIFCVFAFFIAYAANEKNQPTNIPTPAKKVGMHSQQVPSGKYSSEMAGFVTYLTPDGEVSFRMSQGNIYPNEVVLFKQVK